MGYMVNPPSTEELRQLAVKRLGMPVEPDASRLSVEQAHKLLQEVAISKIEADIQNEYLQDTCSRLDMALGEATDLYDSAPLGCMSTDMAGRIIKLNLTAASMLGQERQWLMGHVFTELVAPEHRAHICALMQQVTATGVEQQCGLPLESKKGHVRHIKLSLSPLTRGVGHLLSLTDISAQKAVEEDVRAREARWRFALECSGEGVWEWDVRSGVATYSTTLTQLYGCTGEAFGTTMDAWRERVHPDDWQDFLLGIRKCLSGQAARFQCEQRGTYTDGSSKWMRCTGSVFGRDESGAVTRMLGTVTDISRQKRLEDDLLYSGGVLQAVFESLPHYMAVLDGDAKVLETNAMWNTYALAIGRAYHHGFSNVHYAVLLDAVTGGGIEPRREVLAAVSDVIAGHAPSAHLEYSFLAGMERRWFVLHVMAVRDGRARAVVSHQDVTRYKTEVLRRAPHTARHRA